MNYFRIDLVCFLNPNLRCNHNDEHIWNKTFSIGEFIFLKQYKVDAARHVYWKKKHCKGYVQYSNASKILTTYSGFLHI